MSKEESPSVADIAMKYAGLVSQAAANKAAEEGGLPIKTWGDRMQESGKRECESLAIDCMLAEIDAYRDRASRQVANKAEVDLSSIKRYYMGASDMKQNEAGEWLKLKDVEALLATPPATTGASTAPLDGDRIYAAWHKVGADVAGLKFADFMDAIGPVGASTVLTDERIKELEDLLNSALNREAIFVERIEELEGILKEVAAQAGQVAVPEIERLELELMNQRELAQHWKMKALFPASPSPAKESK